MSREIRKVRDLGNGSGGVTIPKDTLRDWGLVDDDGRVGDGHVAVDETDDGAITVEPVQ
ncbi:hypothetical protein [Halorubrum cibi]|uniref:DUF8053 domain-containing protein n=1 Tax=Halorubrum cibi TaxID=413815 RepID=A0A521EBF4_9EURY|nr:hypothetical protein [Halorubrum cibi]SMO81274.1 hypothetical protein SAMN06264867_11010 [Halorubrum cibi]